MVTTSLDTVSRPCRKSCELLDDVKGPCHTIGMQPLNEGVRFAGRLSSDDMVIVEAAREKLGLRAVTEVLRVALRSLAREHDLAVRKPETTEKP